MANLKEVRDRIASVNSTQQITRAMKMVSAAKLKRAADAITHLRPYAAQVKKMLRDFSRIQTDVKSVYLQARPVKKALLVVITSNRGLAGAFNAAALRAASGLVKEQYASLSGDKSLLFLPFGKKGIDYYHRKKSEVLELPDSPKDIYTQLDFDSVSDIADALMKGFRENRFDEVRLIYNQFKNAGVQMLTTEQLLPLAGAYESEKGDGKSESRTAPGQDNFILEPSTGEIIDYLVPESVRIQLFKALLDSHAAEHGARMTAMDKATENAGELLKLYRLQYNRARQAAITTEILEIVSGANALSGG